MSLMGQGFSLTSLPSKLSGRARASQTMHPTFEDLQQSSTLELPKELIEELISRYDKHGWEYFSGRFTREGQPINTCLQNDSVALALEELVDAIFNLMVEILKGKNRQQDPNQWRAKKALRYTVEAWMILGKRT